MNITTSADLSGPNTALANLQPADPATRAQAASDVEGVEGTSPVEAPGHAFGELFTRRIAGLADAAADSAAKAMRGAADGDAAALRLLDATAGPTASDTVASSMPAMTPDDDDRPAVDTFGNDLAAQMALASQWAGSAANVAPTATRGDATPADADRKVGDAAVRNATPVGNAMATIDASALDARAANGATAVANSEMQFTSAAAGMGAATPKAASPADSRKSAANEIARLVPDASVGSQPAPIVPSPEALPAARAIDGAATATGMPSIATALADALQQRVGTPAWSHEVGHAVLRMATDALQSASISVNPEHLGPMDVRIRVEDGTAHLAFNAAHPETRHALESSRAVLEQIFTQQGLSIGDCSVSDTPSRRFGFDADPSSRGGGGGARDGSSGSRDTAGAEVVMQVRKSGAPGRVDTFA